MPKFYSYVVRHDIGSAPNPFGGLCTLAICKPRIRKGAKPGDWIVGTGSKNTQIAVGEVSDYSHRLIYAMQVTEKMTFEAYNQFCTKKLHLKIPDFAEKDWRKKVGDCIFSYPCPATPKLRRNVHNRQQAEKDLTGEFVLISDHFFYFGSAAPTLPEKLHSAIKSGPGHKFIKNEATMAYLLDWIISFQPNTIHGDPCESYRYKKDRKK